MYWEGHDVQYVSCWYCSDCPQRKARWVMIFPWHFHRNCNHLNVGRWIIDDDDDDDDDDDGNVAVAPFIAPLHCWEFYKPTPQYALFQAPNSPNSAMILKLEFLGHVHWFWEIPIVQLTMIWWNLFTIFHLERPSKTIWKTFLLNHYGMQYDHEFTGFLGWNTKVTNVSLQ